MATDISKDVLRTSSIDNRRSTTSIDTILWFDDPKSIEFPPDIAESICTSYRELAERCGTDDLAVAVRSSATAEDLPQASFAGQQETFLNVRGESELLRACRRCYASLFTDRAIVYRETNGFDHLQVALSIGIQKMVRADLAGSGVMFTLDTETGFPGVVVVSAARGLGENVVQGTVTPDKYLVFKQLLGDERRHPIIEKSLGAKEKKLAPSNYPDFAAFLVEAGMDSISLNRDSFVSTAKFVAARERELGRAK